MNTLNWRTARKVELTEKLIPNPNSQSELKWQLTNVRVAFDGGLVHIDPRETTAPDHDAHNPEFPVYVVPASSVRVIHYMEARRMTVEEAFAE